MNKKYRIKKNKEFTNIYKVGKNYWNRNLIMYISKNNTRYTRFGYSITKKIGNAVVRNKIRRRMKEISRLNYDRIEEGLDIVFIPKKNVVDLSYLELEDSMIHIMKLAKIIDR